MEVAERVVVRGLVFPAPPAWLEDEILLGQPLTDLCRVDVTRDLGYAQGQLDEVNRCGQALNQFQHLGVQFTVELIPTLCRNCSAEARWQRQDAQALVLLTKWVGVEARLTAAGFVL